MQYKCLQFISASITVLICPIGLLIIGILTDKFGRRKTIQIVYAPMALSWLIITFAESYTALLIGKIILGIPFGEFSNILFLIFIVLLIPSHKKINFKNIRLQYLHYYKTCVSCSESDNLKSC